MLPLVVDLPDELTLLSECRLAYILALRDLHVEGYFQVIVFFAVA